MNHSSILSLNVPDPHSVKDRNNIATIMNNKSSGNRMAAAPPYPGITQQQPQTALLQVFQVTAAPFRQDSRHKSDSRKTASLP